MATLNSNRYKIIICGSVNSGKSTLFNKLCERSLSIVSDMEGTTTDPVKKAMELEGAGSVLLVDGAGFFDKSQLGSEREEKTYSEIESADLVLYCLKNEEEDKSAIKKIREIYSKNIVFLTEAERNAPKSEIISKIKDKITVEEEKFLDFINPFDKVILLMPQDKSAPKLRLILPQVETIRRLIDKGAVIIISELENYERVVSENKDARLIITDASYFDHALKYNVNNIELTSFSMLFAEKKGDAAYFKEGLEHFKKLQKNAHILIMEACTHEVGHEDIAQVKLPRLIKKKFSDIKIDISYDFNKNKDYKKYDLVIHCGGCMLTRNEMMRRVKYFKENNIPMTNYGMIFGFLKGGK